ncbi:MAG: MoaD family protein [Chloroflexi bacterium]|nr:MoaD family protein [Chloroflexota bacterium]
MMVEVRVPAPLRVHTQGAKVVEGEGRTVSEVLDNLDQRYPGIKGGLFDRSGDLRQFVNVYVNDEDIRYLGRLKAPVTEGDVVSILPAVAGGA